MKSRLGLTGIKRRPYIVFFSLSLMKAVVVLKMETNITMTQKPPRLIDRGFNDTEAIRPTMIEEAMINPNEAIISNFLLNSILKSFHRSHNMLSVPKLNSPL